MVYICPNHSFSLARWWEKSLWLALLASRSVHEKRNGKRKRKPRDSVSVVSKTLPIYCGFSSFFSSTSSPVQLFIRQILGYISQSGVNKCCSVIRIYDSSLFVRASYSCEHDFSGVSWGDFLKCCTFWWSKITVMSHFCNNTSCLQDQRLTKS